MTAAHAEKVAQAQALRAEGLLLREIAERMGVRKSTAAGYLTDPDRAKQRALRERYAAPCPSCGGPTDGSCGYKRPTSMCRSCREWPDDAIIDAIRRWADDHGGIPPRSVDWTRAAVDHPASATVRNRIGWNRALKLAGYAPHMDRSPETQAWVEAQVRAGRPIREIADKLGVAPAAIYMRMRRCGIPVSALRRQAAR